MGLVQTSGNPECSQRCGCVQITLMKIPIHVKVKIKHGCRQRSDMRLIGEHATCPSVVCVRDPRVSGVQNDVCNAELPLEFETS